MRGGGCVLLDLLIRGVCLHLPKSSFSCVCGGKRAVRRGTAALSARAGRPVGQHGDKLHVH